MKSSAGALNTSLNRLEYWSKRLRLLSTPEQVTLGAHGPCNARCVFCPGGEHPQLSLKAYRDLFEARLGPFLGNARQVTFTGFGELLLIPEAERFLEHLNRTLPETEKILTTNGTPLTPGVVRRLRAGKFLVQVSLHASHAALHQELTGLAGRFADIVAGVRRLTARGGGGSQVEVIGVLTTRNIDDLPELVRLAWKLRARRVRCRYVEVFSPEHLPLSCFFDQERANRSLERARAAEAELRSRDPGRLFEALLPPPFGKKRAKRKLRCAKPWQHVFVELEGSVLPCCSWGEHVAGLEQEDIGRIWNGRFYRKLRGALAGGRPHPWCARCIELPGHGVDDILSHVTNRPDLRAKVVAAMRRGREAEAR